MNRLSSAGAPHRTSMAFYSSQPWPITLDETRLRSRNQGWSSSPNPLTKNPVACQIYIFSNKREFKRKDPIACAPLDSIEKPSLEHVNKRFHGKGKKKREYFSCLLTKTASVLCELLLELWRAKCFIWIILLYRESRNGFHLCRDVRRSRSRRHAGLFARQSHRVQLRHGAARSTSARRMEMGRLLVSRLKKFTWQLVY